MSMCRDIILITWVNVMIIHGKQQTNNVCSSLLSRMGAILDYDFQLFKEYFQFLNRLYDITWCVTVYAK